MELDHGLERREDSRCASWKGKTRREVETVGQKSLMINCPDYMKAITGTCRARENVGKWKARMIDLKMLRWS